MNSALAIKKLGQAEEAKTHNEELEKCLEKINNCVEAGEVHKLFDIDPASQTQAGIHVVLALLLYP